MVEHFYTVDQWEIQDRQEQGKIIVHTPCGWEVEQASIGDKWVCTGCYEEIPEAIGDLIILGDLYKPHWDPITFSSPGPFFYANINWPSLNPHMFYSFMDPYTYTPTGFGFYFQMAGTGTYFI